MPQDGKEEWLAQRLWMIGAAAALALAACGGDETEPAAVTVKVFRFDPSPLEVEAGTDVTWTNQDDIDHTVTAGKPDAETGEFDGPLPRKGPTFSFTFEQPGAYPYFCSVHPSMLGEIRVA